MARTTQSVAVTRGLALFFTACGTVTPPMDPAPPPSPTSAPSAVDSLSVEASLADASRGDAAVEVAPKVALASGCRLAVDLAREALELSADAEVVRLRPELDLDGDGKKDPVFVGGPTMLRVVLCYVEAQGCARLVGELRTNDADSVRVVGRSKQGWATVRATTRFTFDETETKLEHDGTAYVSLYREQITVMVPGKDGPVRRAKAWSPWKREPEPTP